jgi:2-dehydro-3-deoxyglucarate aldolase
MEASAKPGGYHVVQTDHDELPKRIEEGYRFIAYGDDMVMFAQKVKDEGQFLLSFSK